MKRGSNSNFITRNSDSHLICDSSTPLITCTSLDEEAMLYNLRPWQTEQVIRDFTAICNRHIDLNSEVTNLSGGQKVILMAVMAIHSPAKKIVFINLCNNLDTNNSNEILAFIERHKSDKTEIVMI